MTSHAETAAGCQTPGLERTIAFALGALGMDAVQRSTIRALLPKGERKQRGPATHQRRLHGERVSTSKNKTTKAFGQALQDLERMGWIKRTPELVLVRNRAALLRHALRDRPAAPQQLLNLRGALDAIRADMRPSDVSSSAALVEQRRREIRAVMALMQAPPGGDGTGSVRIVHKSQIL